MAVFEQAVRCIMALKIAFVYTHKASFIQQDLKILQDNFDVLPVEWKGIGSISDLFCAIKECDISYSWFAATHAAAAVLVSKLLGKKSIVVVGGYDAACVPEIKYGRFAGNLLSRQITKYALKKADNILVVDESLKEDIIRHTKINGKNIKCMPTGHNPNFWKVEGKNKLKDTVLTVASGTDLKRIKLKGLDVFVKSAKHLPALKFVIVGVSGRAQEHLQEISPDNVEMIGLLDQDALLSYYQKAKVYCQLSIREGLPNALCEAMLCECVPVGTDTQGITSAMGDVGFYVPYGDEKATAEAVREAVQAPDSIGHKARERIKTLFPLSKREALLKKIIGGGSNENLDNR